VRFTFPGSTSRTCSSICGSRVFVKTKNLVAINSALEVDLSGQINAEALGSRQISGAGGISDFLRGAALSPGGRPIVALAATAKAGTISRIVPLLAPGTPVTISRNDVGIVVTEYGIADLRDKSLAARADALIAIAAPQHQANLEASRSQAPQ
jgi:acyl-CoA hydrolase